MSASETPLTEVVPIVPRGRSVPGKSSREAFYCNVLANKTISKSWEWKVSEAKNSFQSSREDHSCSEIIKIILEIDFRFKKKNKECSLGGQECIVF